MSDTRLVIKRDGTKEPFNLDKIERWAAYATRHNVAWQTIVSSTLNRLPTTPTTEEIHETMINVCLDMEELSHSRVAARLLYAQLRKNLSDIKLTDRMPFLDIHTKFTALGLWKNVPYHPRMEAEYKELFKTRLEFWQIQQWMDKYSLRYEDKAIETAHMGALALGYSIHSDPELAFGLAKAIIQGKINLPTPALNGIRNGDWNTISCSVIEGGDSIPSIGVAEHLAYMMTAKKAGIGIRFDTRSIGNNVKKGAVKHLGKVPIYATVDKAVKMFTQVTRGGSATVTFSVYDPEVLELIMLKSQRTPENIRIDKLDYSMAYDNAFVDAVISNSEIQTKSLDGTLGPKYSAREVLKTFLTIRKETGRLYCINLDTANTHTPFIDPITQSNLCMEIALPTKPFIDMNDLYSAESKGEMAFCSLAAVNVTKVAASEYESIAFIAVATLNELINKAEMFADSLLKNLRQRRSLGIGITGLAGYLAKHDKLYADTDFIEQLAERHYYYCLKASQDLVSEYGAVTGINLDWLPIDTKQTTKVPELDWELLRGKERCNSVLVAHMPTESSAVFSDATNGIYPVRRRVINKQSRKGNIQFIAPEVKELAWDIPNIALAKSYAPIQAYADQALSADYYKSAGKVSMTELIQHWVTQAKLGLKTMYYDNTNDFNGGTFQDMVQDGCEGGCKL